MSIRIGTIVLIKKSEPLRGQFRLCESTSDRPWLGVVVGFKNYRNPYAGMGRADKRLFLAEVMMLPKDQQVNSHVWDAAPQIILDSLFDGKSFPCKLENLVKWDQTAKNSEGRNRLSVLALG